MNSVAVLERNAERSPRIANATRVELNSPFLQKVIQSFNTWAFKREQPCRPDLMARTVARAVEQHRPIQFILYWGKGPRPTIAAPELQCLDYLGSLAARVRAVYKPGADFNLVLTDTHAELNGHSRGSLETYFSGVRSEAARRGFACHMLGELTAAAGLGADAADEAVPAEAISLLAQSAMRWYRGEGTALEGAARYYRLNMIEKRVIEKAFPDSIFVTFNGSNQRELFPDGLPIFYMYSTKRGTAVKPWFQETGEHPEKPVESAAAALA
jgi:hypothetical protein